MPHGANKFASELFLSLTGLALLLLLGAYAHVTIGLRPLEKLRSKVAGVRTGKATLVDGAYPDEVMPLVDETNALLAEQEKELQTARARAGDLAHGLNTPLAIMAANARTLRRSGQLDIAAEIDRQIETMHRHVDRELARARARGARRAGHAPVDIAPLLSDLVKGIRSLSRALTTLVTNCDLYAIHRAKKEPRPHRWEKTELLSALRRRSEFRTWTRPANRPETLASGRNHANRCSLLRLVVFQRLKPSPGPASSFGDPRLESSAICQSSYVCLVSRVHQPSFVC